MVEPREPRSVVDEYRRDAGYVYIGTALLLRFNQCRSNAWCPTSGQHVSSLSTAW